MDYAVDLAIPDALFAAVARSTYAHARVLSVDLTRASQVPGVRAAICGADVASMRTGRGVRDVPVLAVDKVRCVGEMVAAIAADSIEIARRAVELVEVEYEPLEAVFDPLEALAPNAPLIHAEPWKYELSARGEDEPPNLITLARRTVGGDIARALASADHVFEHTFRTPKVHQGYLEPYCCIAAYHPDATVTVWSSNKTPYTLRAQLAATFDLPPEHIVVETAAIGGDFGAKGGPLEVPVCLELSRRTGRPVRFLRTYTDELTAGTPAPASVSTLRVGVSASGEIRAFAMRTLLNAGAYGGYAASNLGRMLGGTAYRLPVVDIELVRVYTNEVSNGSMRAPGSMQVVFATEAMMDLVARKLGIDPFEFRRRNLLHTGEPTFTETVWPEHRGVDLLDLAQRACQPLPPTTSKTLVGRGIAVNDRPTHVPLHTSVCLRLTSDGTLELLTPIQETGTGSHTVAQHVVARELGVARDRVAVRHVSTARLPFDFGVGGQLITGSLSHACALAARALRDQLKARDIDLTRTREGSAAWPSIDVEIETEEGSLQEGGVITYCVQVADVAVDVDTGEVRVLDLISAHDVAEIIDPVSHRGQITGGVAMGLGFARSEDLSIVDGRVAASHLGDYKLPCVKDMPPLRVVLLEGGQGIGPMNTKAIGEMGQAGVAPAIANAVSAAIGACVDALPITSENVFNLLRADEFQSRRTA
jgi:CO/xanthine dehydrogenase Mo-binding subunit